MMKVYKKDSYDSNSLEINYDKVLKYLQPTLKKDGNNIVRVEWSMHPNRNVGHFNNDR